MLNLFSFLFLHFHFFIELNIVIFIKFYFPFLESLLLIREYIYITIQLLKFVLVHY